MSRRSLWIALLSGATFIGTALAQKQATPKQPTKDSVAEENVKHLLLLMDTDKNGKISKQEWMKFMEAQFDTLDKDKKGDSIGKSCCGRRCLSITLILQTWASSIGFTLWLSWVRSQNEAG